VLVFCSLRWLGSCWCFLRWSVLPLVRVWRSCPCVLELWVCLFLCSSLGGLPGFLVFVLVFYFLSVFLCTVSVGRWFLFVSSFFLGLVGSFCLWFVVWLVVAALFWWRFCFSRLFGWALGGWDVIGFSSFGFGCGVRGCLFGCLSVSCVFGLGFLLWCGSGFCVSCSPVESTFLGFFGVSRGWFFWALFWLSFSCSGLPVRSWSTLV